MKLFNLIVVATLSLLVGSCSSYNKVVKGDDYQLKFDKANKLYEEKDFDRCIVLYEQIYQHSPKTGEGELAYYRLAKSYYEIEDFYMSSYYFGQYIQRYPYSQKNEEAYFLMALSSVKNSPEYSLDQTETEGAINTVQQFIDRYPNSTLVDSCNRVIDRLRFKLELKEYEHVKLYDKTENYRAAVTSGEIFLENYSKSKFCEEVYFLIVKNSYLLSINSIESKKIERIDKTTERITNFAILYPNSNYLKEVKTIENKINQFRETKTD
jgi:outer membrane protein assembly factor BamD